MTEPRDETRARLVAVTERLLSEEGFEAVTTRAVAAAAGVQAPTIYRLFGDKDGLLDAVAEHGFATWVAEKQRRRPHPDPVIDLREGWTSTIEFGLAHPGLAVLMADPRKSVGSSAASSGIGVLAARVHRVALAGRLAVGEQRAIDLIHAAGTGVVLSLLGQPADERDPTLADVTLGAVLAVVLTDAPATGDRSAAAAAVTLRAALPSLDVLSDAERVLLGEWLDRIAGS